MIHTNLREIKEEGCGAQQKKPGKCGWEEFRLGFAFWHLGAALSLALLLLLLLHQIKDHTYVMAFSSNNSWGQLASLPTQKGWLSGVTYHPTSLGTSLAQFASIFRKNALFQDI